jgi:hypothetical protein
MDAPSAEGNQSATSTTLELEIASLREMLRVANATADELRQDRDKWRSVATGPADAATTDIERVIGSDAATS